jgi:beta-1,4-mannosyltransferase
MSRLDPASRRSPVRVLSAPGPRDGSTNQTVTMLVEALPETVQVRTFSWVRAFLSRYDVLHVHWPEYLMRHRTRIRAGLKRALFALLLIRTGLARTPVVWTVHNVRPHERGPLLERLLLSLWSRRATRRVYMYESALPDPPGPGDVCIPRGDYEPLYGTLRVQSSSVPVPTRKLLLFGVLRPYKGIESLVDAVRQTENDGIELLVTGGTRDEAYARRLVEHADGATNVTVRVEILSDEALGKVILDSTMVVLPYRHMYNSGAALLSLTLRRPILVPASPTMLELQREVGERWVHVYVGELTADDLRRALRAVEAPPVEGPNLSRRDWGRVGRSYAELYASILGSGESTTATRGRSLPPPARRNGSRSTAQRRRFVVDPVRRCRRTVHSVLSARAASEAPPRHTSGSPDGTFTR